MRKLKKKKPGSNGEKNVLAEQLRNADKELQELRDRIHEIEATIAGDKLKSVGPSETVGRRCR